MFHDEKDAVTDVIRQPRGGALGRRILRSRCESKGHNWLARWRLHQHLRPKTPDSIAVPALNGDRPIS